MPLFETLRRFRTRSRKSLQEVAEEVDASKAYIWELETGRATNPSIELLKKLAKCLGVSVADLIEENPQGQDERPELVTMYRELKELTPEDRQAIQTMMDHFRRRRG